MLTQERLKELLTYNPETGLFYWNLSVGGSASGSQAGTITLTGYVQIRIDNKSYKAHRLAWLYENGKLPKVIDHANGIKTDNRISNLRKASYLKNNWNRSIQKNSTTGVKGVTFNKKDKKYHASVSKNYKRFFVGVFDSLCEAEREVKAFRQKLHGEFTNHG